MHIIGADEVGYGAWAGPLVIGAIRAYSTWNLESLRDSKKLNREQRAAIAKHLLKIAKDGEIEFSLQISNNDDIDKHRLGVCHKRCYAKAINELYKESDSVVIDGNINPIHYAKYGLKVDLQYVKSEIKADSLYPVVMAASILAKHYRDTLMIECHNSYPNYAWNENVGYIVPEHRQAVSKYGFSSLHRKSYNVKL